MMQHDRTRGTRPQVLLVAGAEAELAGVPGYLAELGCLVSRCATATEAVQQAATLRPQLIVVAEPALLELLSLCRTLRGSTQSLLLVLGQREVEEDEVLCIEYGADEYLAVSASPRRIRAHVWALLRRGQGEVRAEVDQPLRFGDVRIDLARHRVYRGDVEVELSQKEYALLLFLVEHAGRAVTRQALVEFVWGNGAVSENRSLDVHIHWLRDKLEVDAGNPRYIRTVRGVGYCFELSNA